MWKICHQIFFFEKVCRKSKTKTLLLYTLLFFRCTMMISCNLFWAMLLPTPWLLWRKGLMKLVGQYITQPPIILIAGSDLVVQGGIVLHDQFLDHLVISTSFSRQNWELLRLWICLDTYFFSTFWVLNCQKIFGLYRKSK